MFSTRHKRSVRKISTYLNKTSRDNPCDDASHDDTLPDDTPRNLNDTSTVDHTPDDNPPGDTHSNDIPPYDSLSTELKNILAFHTITTLLSWIQQAQAFKVLNVKPIKDKKEHQEMKIVSLAPQPYSHRTRSHLGLLNSRLGFPNLSFYFPFTLS
jgi:hypothetical protein